MPISERKKLRTPALTWLGHCGFLIETADTRILIDPYLSDSMRASHNSPRSFPTPFSIEELMPDLVCCTSEKEGHFDEQTMLPIYHVYPETVIIAPESVVRHCITLGMRKGRTVTLYPDENSYVYNDVRIRAISTISDNFTAVGFLIETRSFSLYYTGDTAYDARLVGALRNNSERTPDLVIACIDGAEGNMNGEDAAGLITDISPQFAIPMHYGLFEANTADPTPFRNAIERAGVKAMTLKPGKRRVIPVTDSEQRHDLELLSQA